LAIALLALILAIVELAKPSEQITKVPQTPTPAPATATPTPASATPSATPTPATPAVKLTTWPAGHSAWTIVLNSSGTRADAERLAADLQGKGIASIGVLNSNDFESLGPDSFVVFSGVYASQALADEALAQIRDQAGGGSTRRIVPKKK
jgi:septal ring-binding cell division protein DamX